MLFAEGFSDKIGGIMDLKVLFATFGAVFMAELADKTQIVGLSISSKSGKPLSVWIGSVSAYIVITAVTVVIGATLGKYIKPELVKYVSGTIFIIMGTLIFMGKF